VPFLKSHGISAQRTATLPAVGFIRTNFQAPPFNDPRARQALVLIFDQKDFMAAVAGDNVAWQSCYSYSVCGSVLGTEIGSDAYRHPDLAKAKQLLTEAGYHGEKVVVVSSPQLPIVAALAQVAAQRMHDAGINVSLQMGDWANVFSEVTSRARAKGPDTWNVFASYSLGGTWFHPLTNVALDLSCEGSVMGFPCDPEDEALRQKVLSAPDDAARKSSFEAFQRQMWQFIPYVPVGQFDIDNAWRKNISGVLTSYVIAYWNIEKH
jgi:peptide/nickel transport system substrate-binding protein